MLTDFFKQLNPTSSFLQTHRILLNTCYQPPPFPVSEGPLTLDLPQLQTELASFSLECDAVSGSVISQLRKETMSDATER